MLTDHIDPFIIVIWPAQVQRNSYGIRSSVTPIPFASDGNISSWKCACGFCYNFAFVQSCVLCHKARSMTSEAPDAVPVEASLYDNYWVRLNAQIRALQEQHASLDRMLQRGGPRQPEEETRRKNDCKRSRKRKVWTRTNSNFAFPLAIMLLTLHHLFRMSTHKQRQPIKYKVYNCLQRCCSACLYFLQR